MLHSNPEIISSVTYAWCFEDNVFNEEELKKIIDYCDTLEKAPGNILTSDSISKQNTDVRVSEISWVSLNQDSEWFFSRISNTIDYLNESYYGYDLYGFKDMQYAKYDALYSGKYDHHMDMILGVSPGNIQIPRKLSAGLLLSDDFEGGEFEFGFDQKENPKFKAGTLIVFPSFMIHRVKPVTKGIRRSLVTWCVGPKFK